MHIIFQYPIIDLRNTVSGANGRLKEPIWPDPQESDKAFISGFGKVQYRNAGGSDIFPGEANYCSANSAIRFNNLQHQGFSENLSTGASIFNSYRRYYDSGRFVGKVELGLVDNLEKVVQNDPDQKTVQISSILKHYANLVVSVGEKQVKLYKAGPLLAERYQRESTSKDKHDKINRDYVQSGELTILLIYSRSTLFNLPGRSFFLDKIKLTEGVGELELYGYKLKQDGYPIKVWIITKPSEMDSSFIGDRAILRDLRMNLLRIHLEKETIKIILNAIQSEQIVIEKGSKAANDVNFYFQKTSEKLFRKYRYDIKQKNLFDFALQSERTIAKGTFISLKENITYFQNNFMVQNLEKLVTGMAKKPILFICSNPKNKNFISFDKEFNDLQNNHQQGIDKGHYDVKIKLSVRKERFEEILKEFQPQFLHLSMHSSIKEGLYFEDDDRNSHPMSVDEFKNVIKKFSKKNGLKLVLISACNSKSHAEAIKKFCECAIGTQAVFPVPAALLYSYQFYKTLFNGENLENCHSEAIRAIEERIPKFDDLEYDTKVIPVHTIPVLIKNANYV